MRIAYVVSRWGEPTQTFVRREVDAAVGAGHQIVVLSLKAPFEVDLDRVPVHHLSTAGVLVGFLRGALRHPMRCARALTRAIVLGRPRTASANVTAAVIGVAASRTLPQVNWIQAHFNWVAGTAADALATIRRQPFGVFPHAFDIFDRRFVDRYTGDKLRRAALVLVESDRIATETNQLFGCDALVQRMGVPDALVVEEPRQRHGRLVVSVGSLLPKKGHDDLIRAVAATPGTSLRILGEGPQRDALEGLALELQASDRVELSGSVPASAVVAHLDEADVFALASKPTADGDRDGVPNVLIEAMARGLPVLSTRVSGIPDLLGDGCGVLVDPGDVAAITEGIEMLIGDPTRAHGLAKSAMRRVAEDYTTEVNWRVLEDRIRRALDSE